MKRGNGGQIGPSGFIVRKIAFILTLIPGRLHGRTRFTGLAKMWARKGGEKVLWRVHLLTLSQSCKRAL